jgi:hypothetical protein
MAQCYAKVSDNNRLPHARQIYYVARPLIERTDKLLSYSYFSQRAAELVNEHGAGWDVVYDDRGLHRAASDASSSSAR